MPGRRFTDHTTNIGIINCEVNKGITLRRPPGWNPLTLTFSVAPDSRLAGKGIEGRINDKNNFELIYQESGNPPLRSFTLIATR
jgi:hypothetical protein